MASGGRVPFLDGANAKLARYALIASRYGLQVSSGLRPGDSDSHHGRGNALDIAGPGGEMLMFAKLMARRFGKGLEELIHTPLGFGIKDGRRVPPYAVADHFDHVHVADVNPAGGAGGFGLFDKIGKISVDSKPKSFMSTLIEAAGNKVRKAANKYLGRKAMQSINYNPGGPRDRSVMPPGALKGLIARAMQFVGVSGPGWKDMLYDRAIQESAGNPNAINNWDSNAAAGMNSRGLFQTIPSTFSAYRSPKLPNNIYNPLANAVAAIKYMISRYGKGDPSVALRAMNARRGVGYASGGPVGIPRLGSVPGVGATFKEISNAISIITEGNGLKKVLKSIRNLFADDGPMSRFAGQIDELTSRVSSRITAARFRTGRRGRVRENFGDEAQLQLELRGLQSVGTGLARQEERATNAQSAARAALDIARANKDKKAIAVAKAAIKAAKLQVKEIRDARQQNEADIFGKQEEIAQSFLDQNTERLDRIDTRASVTQRIREARGFSGPDPTTLKRLRDRQATLQFISKFSSSKDVRQQAKDELLELDAAIAEAQASIFDARIDEIDKQASRSATLANRFNARAELAADNGNTAQSFLLRRNSLNTSIGAGRSQITALTSALAQLDPNSDKAKELRDRIEDLTVELAQNQEALSDLTTEFTVARFTEASNSFGFLGSIATAGVAVANSLGNLVGGVLNTPAVQAFLEQNRAALLGQRGAAIGGINDLFGRDVGLGQLSGIELINALLAIAKTNPFTDPEQKDAFQAFVNALIANEQAIIDNTKQMEDLTNPSKTQSWSTTSWQLFRNAIFNGAGGLLPQFAQTVPQMATGGMILNNGLIYAHAGEMVVRAADVMRGNTTGDTNIYITSPTEVLDPYHVASVLSYRRSLQDAV
jgi:hypothetical protein